tara:strand:- start:1038 stop:1823 length:786 start_codon:yes stop_codon:yes gene_type:complete
VIKIILTLLIITNLILIYFLNKKKIKRIIYKKKIKSKDTSDLHQIFATKKISDNLFGPAEEAIIRSFCISVENDIKGMTSDYEAWILSSLSKVSKNIFEFGTCSGKTTFLMGLNSPKDAKIITLTLNSEQTNDLIKKTNDTQIPLRNIYKESIYEKFLFSNTNVENKIQVMFKNSMNFEIEKYRNKFDLIFIDGGHTYSVVKNDSEKSFEMLKSKGIILWHDYVPGKKSAKDVVKYIHEISSNKKIFHLRNTSLCYFKNNK